MEYKVKLIKTILNLNEISYVEFNVFLLEVQKVFTNNMTEFNKVMNQFKDGKRRFINRNYNNFVSEFRNLFNVFLNNEIFDDLIVQISNPNLYKKFLDFINYINKNIEFKIKMVECIDKLEQLNIAKVNFVNELDTTIECSETRDGQYYKLHGFYSDGDSSIIDKVRIGYTNNFLVKIENANYIINYFKDSIDGLKNIKVYIKNLEFEPTTLPSYKKLHGLNCWQSLYIYENNSKKYIRK